MNEATAEERITSRIDKSVTQQLAVRPTGALAAQNVDQLMELAKMMAVASVAVPKHLRTNPGACLAVAIQASEWEMSPFAVANKSYVVNDRLAYEAQLVNAVILRRAPIKGRFKISYTGEGNTRKCMVSATLNDGDTVEYESPMISKIPVQNSPLWKGDPDQQLFYYSSRAMCRRHFPDVLLGIYTPEELGEAIDITATTQTIPEAKIGKIATRPAVEDKKPAESVIEEAMRVEAEAHAHIAKDEPQTEETPVAPTVASEPAPVSNPPESGPSAATLLAVLVKKAKAQHNMSKSVLTARLIDAGLLADDKSLEDLDAKQLANIIDGLDEMGGAK